MDEAQKSFVDEKGEVRQQLRYLNKEKFSQWSDLVGRQFTPKESLIGKLDPTIPTEADLVNLGRGENPLPFLRKTGGGMAHPIPYVGYKALQGI